MPAEQGNQHEGAADAGGEGVNEGLKVCTVLHSASLDSPPGMIYDYDVNN